MPSNSLADQAGHQILTRSRSEQTLSTRAEVTEEGAVALAHEIDSGKYSIHEKDPDEPKNAREENTDSEGATTTTIQDARPQPPPSSTDFPEGGWRGWITVAAAFMVQFNGFGYASSFGVYQSYYVQEYLPNESSSAISWIGSVNTFICIGFGLVTGRLYDKGYFYYLTTGGALLLSFSLFMLSLAKPNQYYQIFLAQGIGMGLGAGTLYIPSIAVVSHYFHKKRALAMTIVASGSSLGAVVHPIMLNNTLYKIGFGNAVRASAGLVSGMLLIAVCLLHPRLPPPKQTLGFLQAAKKFVKDPAYVFATMGLTIFTVGYYLPLYYIQLDSELHGLGSTFSFYTLVLVNGASCIGRLTPGFITKYVSVPIIISIATFGCSIMLFAMIGVSTVAGVVVFGLLFGFFAGTYITLMAPLMVVVSENLTELGIRMGIAFAFSGIGSLIGAPISGALLTGDYIWWRAAVFDGVVAMLGSVCFVVMTILLHRRDAAREAAALQARDAEKS